MQKSYLIDSSIKYIDFAEYGLRGELEPAKNAIVYRLLLLNSAAGFLYYILNTLY